MRQTYCSKCRSLGIVRVVNLEQGLDSLAYCTCEWSKNPGQALNLPVINEKIEKAFTISACPLEWFLPGNKRGSVAKGHLMATVDPKVSEWRKRLDAAAIMWNDWGILFDPNFKPVTPQPEASNSQENAPLVDFGPEPG